jgi:hypothetical protein
LDFSDAAAAAICTMKEDEAYLRKASGQEESLPGLVRLRSPEIHGCAWCSDVQT